MVWGVSLVFCEPSLLHLYTQTIATNNVGNSSSSEGCCQVPMPNGYEYVSNWRKRPRLMKIEIWLLLTASRAASLPGPASTLPSTLGSDLLRGLPQSPLVLFRCPSKVSHTRSLLHSSTSPRQWRSMSCIRQCRLLEALCDLASSVHSDPVSYPSLSATALRSLWPWDVTHMPASGHPHLLPFCQGHSGPRYDLDLPLNFTKFSVLNNPM